MGFFSAPDVCPAALAEKLEMPGDEIDDWIVRPAYAIKKLLEDRARADYVGEPADGRYDGGPIA